MDVLEELVRLRRSGERCALATIVEVDGSVPSFESAKMLVRQDGSIVGTVGGGCVEGEVRTVARAVMETGKPRLLSFNLSHDAAYQEGLICGGQLEIFVEPIEPQLRAFLFGAGHISQSLAQVTRLLGFHTTVIDSRESFANRERFPEAEEIVAAGFEEVFPQLPINSSSYLIIVTRGHRDDMLVLRWAVTTAARYIALIGSKRKVISVVAELEKEGVPRERLERIYGPMGLAIGALTPEEIAISVGAEMVAVHRQPKSNWQALSMSFFRHDESKAPLP
jgi:xanthine dehydrogenase accessory factor